jgi:hypothetical protein
MRDLITHLIIYGNNKAAGSRARAATQRAPKGSRNRLSEEFLRAFVEDFERHGAGVIELVRSKRPQDYLKVAASLIPKQIEIEPDRPRPVHELSDEELSASISDGIDRVIDRILLDRGHAPLNQVERERLKQGAI